MRVWTGPTGGPATPTPNGHHLPPIPDARPRGPAHLHHSHASGARATGSASRGPPPGGGWSVHLTRRLPPRVSGRSAVGGTTRHGHAAKGACSRPKAWARDGRQPPPQPTKRQGTDDTSQQRGHDASSPRADAEMTETSGPQESADPLPAATTCSVPEQREPSMEYLPGGHPGTTSQHPSTTSATLDQDRLTIPPRPRRPPQQRGTGPFDNAELRALYGIHASTPSRELVAALREHLRDVPNRHQALCRGPPATRRNNRNLCGAAPGARHPRGTGLRQPC